MIWIAFFSQTGSEIIELSRSIRRIPDYIVYNGQEVPKAVDSLGSELILFPKKPTSQDYYNIFKDDFIATFHGWLRIVPHDVCNAYEGLLFNGHPGLITKYPELKGKDPQKRVLSGNYEEVGSVVHILTSEVDGGEILHSSSQKLPQQFSEEDVFSILKETSLITWESFFKEKLL